MKTRSLLAIAGLTMAASFAGAGAAAADPTKAQTLTLVCDNGSTYTVVGLAESAHFAERHGVDMATFRAVIDAGQMSSTISRAKLQMLVSGEYPVAAGLSDVLMNSRLVADAARASGTAAPLMEASEALFAEAVAMGLGGQDMAAVVHAIAQRDRK